MTETILDTAVVGAGAAGLHVGRLLVDRGVRTELFEGHSRVGDSWRERYRSLRLFSPSRVSSLPGLPLDIGFFAFPTAQQMGDYLERYATHFGIPVRTDAAVDLADAGCGGRLPARSGERRCRDRRTGHRRGGRPSRGEDSGLRARPRLAHRPAELGRLPRPGAARVRTRARGRCRQLRHRHRARGRPQRPPGDDLRATPRARSPSTSTRRSATSCPGSSSGACAASPIDTEQGRAARDAKRGIMLVRNKLADLERAGITRVGRIESVAGGMPVTADGTVDRGGHGHLGDGVTARLRLDPRRRRARCRRRTDPPRGIALRCPDLAFVGLDFQYSAASGALFGMGADAEYVVNALYSADQPRMTGDVAVRQD